MRKYIIYISWFTILLSMGVGFFIAKSTLSTTPDTTAIVKEIRGLNRWETVTFTVEKIIDSGTTGNIFQQFLFGNRILLIAHGEAIGGFDLSNFSQNDITTNGSEITITLPPPQILITSLDNAKTQVYDRQQGLLVAPSNDMESKALASAQKAIQDAACNEGILTTASTNAKTILTSLLTSLGFTKITITIPQGHC